MLKPFRAAPGRAIRQAKAISPEDLVGDVLPRGLHSVAAVLNGWTESKSTLEEMNKITAILDEGLREGALGVGSTIGYMRTGITTYEMLEAQRAAARYGRLTAAHTRFHANNFTPVEGLIGHDELIVNGILLKAPVIAQRNRDYGFWEVEEKLQMARGMGLNLWYEYYPYDAASSGIGSEYLRPEAMKQMVEWISGKL